MTDLNALLERVKAAPGPDREIDAAIGSMARYHPYGPFHWLDRSPKAAYAPTHAGWMGFTLPGEDTPRDAWASPEYTDSIDAALTLAKRALPDWVVQTNGGDPTRMNHREPWAKVAPYDTNDDGWKIGAQDARCATLPLAILAATLSALIAKEATS